MKPLLFAGEIAYFSPFVPDTLRECWVKRGGILSTFQRSSRAEQVRFFCNGRNDPWWPRMPKDVAVFHAHWVSHAAAENFLIPIASYVLDRGYTSSPSSNDGEQLLARDDVHEAITSNIPKSAPFTPMRQVAETPKEPPALPSLPMKRPYESLFEPQSEERPTKRPRCVPKIEGEPDMSTICYVEQPNTRPQIGLRNPAKAVQLSQEAVPFINLLEVAVKKRKSSSSLRYTPASDPNDKKHSLSLPFSVGGDGIPRVSLSVVQTTLRAIKTEDFCIVKADRLHLGQTFRLMPEHE